MLTDQTFKCADAAIAALLAVGYVRADYDLIYPYMLGEAMMARAVWCDRRQRYILEGVRL